MKHFQLKIGSSTYFILSKKGQMDPGVVVLGQKIHGSVLGIKCIIINLQFLVSAFAESYIIIFVAWTQVILMLMSD